MACSESICSSSRFVPFSVIFTYNGYAVDPPAAQSMPFVDRVWSASRSPGQAKLHRVRVHMSDKPVYKGLGLLEWANAIVPQGALVKTARTSWNLIWKVRWRRVMAGL
jgi:hypothetical protein